MFKFKSMKTRLTVAFMLLTFVPMLILTGYVYYELKSNGNETQNSEKEALNKVSSEVTVGVEGLQYSNIDTNIQIVDERIDSLINESKNLSQQIKSSQGLLDLPSSETEKIIGELKTGFPSASYAYIGTAEGTFLIAPRPEGLPADYDPTGTDWYKGTEKLKDGKVNITDAYLSSDGKDLMITVATPLYNGDNLLGVIAVDSILSTFSERVSTVTVGETGYIIVTDKNGMIIAHKDTKLVGKNIKDLNLKQVKELHHTLNGEKVISLSSKNDVTGWTTYAIQPEKEYNTIMTGMHKTIKDTENTLAGELKGSIAGSILTLIISTLVLVALSGVAGYFVAVSIVKPITRMVEVTNNIANGDLSSKIEIKSTDEIDILAKAINAMVENLRKVITDLTDITRKVKTTSDLMDNQVKQSNDVAQAISSSMSEVASGSESLTTNMIDVSNVIDNINVTTSQYVTGMQTVTSSMTKASDVSKQGLVALNKVAETMTTIEGHSEKSSLTIQELDVQLKEISNITKMINEIAEQTNLLSLNARIEAARAGEQGKGFAVVANEVRKLAEQSQKAVGTISVLVEDIQSKSQDAVKSMSSGVTLSKEGTVIVSEATDYFNDILSNINALTKEVDTMATKSTELKRGTVQISGAVQEVVAISEQTTASSEEVASSMEIQSQSNQSLSDVSKELKELSETLDVEVSKFTL